MKKSKAKRILKLITPAVTAIVILVLLIIQIYGWLVFNPAPKVSDVAFEVRADQESAMNVSAMDEEGNEIDKSDIYLTPGRIIILKITMGNSSNTAIKRRILLNKVEIEYPTQATKIEDKYIDTGDYYIINEEIKNENFKYSYSHLTDSNLYDFFLSFFAPATNAFEYEIYGTERFSFHYDKEGDDEDDESYDKKHLTDLPKATGEELSAPSGTSNIVYDNTEGLFLPASEYESDGKIDSNGYVIVPANTSLEEDPFTVYMVLRFDDNFFSQSEGMSADGTQELFLELRNSNPFMRQKITIIFGYKDI